VGLFDGTKSGEAMLNSKITEEEIVCDEEQAK